MSYRRLPNLTSAFRFDSIAQLGGFAAAVGLLSPVVMALQGFADAVISTVFVLLGTVGLVVLVVRTVLLRRSYASGDEVDATVVEVRPSLAAMKKIIYEYPVDGQTLRRSYTVSAKLLYSADPGRKLRLVVPKGKPGRPFLRDLYE